jgi:hypothetical protein
MSSSEAEGVGQILVGYKKVTAAWEGTKERRKRQQILAVMHDPERLQPMTDMATSANQRSRRVWSSGLALTASIPAFESPTTKPTMPSPHSDEVAIFSAFGA